MPFLILLKGLGNNEFPNWNPQTEFTSVEENRLSPENCLQFCTGTDLFILLSISSKYHFDERAPLVLFPEFEVHIVNMNCIAFLDTCFFQRFDDTFFFQVFL